ncbi:uridine diphosphate-N-acetylglucosamine-binding protein YvcK [Candidatus Parcubacteria bacterium]|nr:MAG: uridine diphosphate-N-acetylglucosamine-binding protein YvcK [Candidatus Parcubacteria bacterium]
MAGKKIVKITTIGGGSGQYVLLSGLRDIRGLDITAVVSMVDSGGSTGRLRDEFGILPPGDILKCLLALSPNREVARKLLLTRFRAHPRLRGHNAGNMLLSILSQYTGKFPAGVEALGEILGVKGKIYPVTIDRATLVAELDNGRRIYGEAAIDVPRGDVNRKIKSAFLVPHHQSMVKVYPPVIRAIKEADFVIIGPGDLYTSIIPNFLVPGVARALKSSRTPLIYVLNLMTKFGETDDFKANDFLNVLEGSIGRKIDWVIVNSRKPSSRLVKRYAKQKAKVVENNLRGRAGTKVIFKDILDQAGGIIRHDTKKLAKAIEQIIKAS